MDFVARLLDGDGAMLLFTLRRAGADAEVEKPAKGGSDKQLRGTVPEANLETLRDALAHLRGALHAGDHHWRLDKGAHEADSLEAAEEGLPGPFTVPGSTRSLWSFGGDEVDRVCQRLFWDGKQDVKTLHQATGLRVEEVMRALQGLTTSQTVRRYRVEGAAEQYDLSGTERSRIAAGCPH
jgi:hypothetical protein